MRTIAEQLNQNIIKKRQRQKLSRKARYMKDTQRQKEKVQIKKKLYGDYYNYNMFKLNSKKKGFLQEGRNTQIERQNRILLEKMQNIFKRSNIRKQHHYASVSVENKTLNIREMRNHSLNRIHSKNIVQDPEQRRFDTQNSLDRKMASRVVLFKGKKVISGQKCFVNIFIDAVNYQVNVERGKVQQQIKIPVQDYKFLQKYSLKGDPIRIFNYLQISEDGYLEIKGIQQNQTEVIQHGQVTLPKIF